MSSSSVVVPSGKRRGFAAAKPGLPVFIVCAFATLAGLLGAVGCKSASRESAGTGAASESVSTTTAAVVLSPAIVGDGGPAEAGDAGTEGGGCANVGSTPTGDGGTICLGALAQSTFTKALCSCNSVRATGAAFTTDGFDSTKGPPDGGLGGNVANDDCDIWSGKVSIGGDLQTVTTLTSSVASVVRGNLELGGAATPKATLTVDGNALVGQALPKQVVVDGTTSLIASVPGVCDCTDQPPIASIVAARASNNDNASINLSPLAATGNSPVTLDLPCGNFYLAMINIAQPVTLNVHGHAALYVAYGVTVSKKLTVNIDPGASLDWFVDGSFWLQSASAVGSTTSPAQCRAYVDGPEFVLTGTTTLGCNFYAPNAALSTSATTTVYGSLYVNDFTAGKPTTIHYDESIGSTGSTCSSGASCTPASCDDGNPCTTDTCNPDGTCGHASVGDGTACTGTNLCEQTYACQAGVCTGSNPVTCTASDACHVAGTCNPATGACSNPDAGNGTSCSDGNACTQSDSCQAGVCTGSNPVTCMASDACHVAGVCNPSSGACSNPSAADGTSCSDGNACTQSDACQAGVCTGSNPVTCTASDQCHTAGTCNPSTGTCSNPTASDGSACNDGNACTQSDACQAGVCTGSNPVTCTASDQCHAAGTCDPKSGSCSNPAAANGTTCSDGNACTQGDACQNGSCVGATPVTCNAPGQCQSGGSCDPVKGCVYTAAADGSACTGTNKCNETYQCSAGTCVGSNPVTCAASDACHVAGTCDPTSGSCSNPAAADGTACNDENACTHSDTCKAGACTGGSPVTCAASDACHFAGACNPATGACSNPAAPSGTACAAAADGGPTMVCNGAGACVAPQGSCAPGQTSCSGICQSTQSDPSHCGACGHVCTHGYACFSGTCVSPPVAASCRSSSSLSVLYSADGVTAYVPRGSMVGARTGITGVDQVVLQGSTAQAQTIPTPKAVSMCSSNWVTGATVCMGNGTDVYVIQGATITASLTSGALVGPGQSGGACANCAITVDSAHNMALLAMGVGVDGGAIGGGYQLLDLATNTFAPPFSAGPGASFATSENPSFDPVRDTLLSANESGDFQLVQLSAGGSPAQVFDNQFPFTGTLNPKFDAAGEDCATGIALASIEEANPPALTLVDLTQATFTPGSPNGTWTAPSSTATFPGLRGVDARPNTLELTGLAVADASHLGLMTQEFGGGTVAVFQLPSSAGSGTPALVDWAGILITTDPTGAGWSAGTDPHQVTAFTNPGTGRAMGLIANDFGESNSPPTYVVLLDLQGILDAPRTPGTHNVDPSYDLVGHGLLTFVPLPCSQTNTYYDVNNCGACGNVCAKEPNAGPLCNVGTCALECYPGFADCNATYGDGCEANLLTDPSACGQCGTNCSAPNAVGTCTAGVCGVQCNPGFSDCDGKASNGCETQGTCAPLSLALSGPATVTVGTVAAYAAQVTEPVPGRTLAYAWTQASGPGTITFSAPDALTTTANFSEPGTYGVQFEVSDGFDQAVGALTVTASYVNLPPVVSAGPTLTLTAPTMTATLSGTVTDDGLPHGGSLTASWSMLGGPVPATVATPTFAAVPEPGPLTATTAVTFAYPGTYTFQLTASDTNLAGYATQTVQVNAPLAIGGGGGGTSDGGAGPSAPTVAIAGVTDDQEVTKPTPILATVSDGAWVLQSRMGGRDDVETPWQVLATGIGPVSGTQIAIFDPTLLRNGIYTVQLSSANSVGSTSTSVSLSVDGRMKVGDFTLTFTDLSTAVGGLPLSVTRVYDSRDKTLGDFGYGWKLGISDVTVTKSGKIGAYWTQQFNDLGVFSQFCLLPTQAASVAITMPGGRQYRFAPQASPQCVYGSEDTAPDIVWLSNSDAGDATITLAVQGTTAFAGSAVFAADVGNRVTELQDGSGKIWDPRRFVLTIEDGSQWYVDQDLGVTKLVARDGSYVEVTPEGILHSTGTQVLFQRDAQNRITSITDPNGAAMSYAYDANGDLASFTDRLANVTQFAYADSHYLTQIQDPLGRLPLRNEFDSSGRLLSTTDAQGHSVTYAANLATNQEQVTDRLGHVTFYTYNERGDITQKVDPSGAVWNYTVDLRGNQLTATDPLGRVTTKTYDGADNNLTQIDALGNVTTNTYDLFKDMVTSTDPLGHVTRNAFDGFGNLVATTDALGNTTHFTYDLITPSNRITQTDPLDNVTHYNVYDSAGHVLQETDAAGHVTNHTYDANGNKTGDNFQRTEYYRAGGTVTTSYTYDPVGHLLSTMTTAPGVTASRSTTYTATGKRATTIDGDGRVTKYTYDELDRLVATANPDGTTTSQSYDAENHRISSTDAAGNTTRYAYDPVGRLVRTTYPDGTSTATAYDAAGQAVQTADELGNVTWTAYDAVGRRTGTTSPLGEVTESSYDAAGNLQSAIDALGHRTSYAYDADNRVVATTYADGSADSSVYDPSGRVTSRVDTLGRTKHYAYDSLGHLIKVTDALGGLTTYGYDETGARVTQVDANSNLTGFVYDWATSALVSRVLPTGATESFTDDPAGQITAHKDFNGATTRYTYDGMGRVLNRAYPDGGSVSFTYTPTGRRATATDARGTTVYSYDLRDRLVQVSYPDGRVLAYGYDAHGNRTTLTATLGTTTLTTQTAYDAAGRPSTVTDPLGRAFGMSYDADDAPTLVQYPNGTETSYAYDARHRVTSIAAVETATSTPITAFGYTLDTEGERTQVTETDGTVRQYGYDSLSRLTTENVTGALTYTKTFGYDAVGNRLSQTTAGSGAGAVTYAYDARDRLTTENATAYSYDANGNLTSKAGEATYGWDPENRLTSIKLASGALVTNQYDADGNRVQTAITPPTVAGTSVACSGNGATFVREDNATLGNWQGTYGSDGYTMHGGPSVAPSYGSISFSNTNDYTWSSSTADPRALQLPPPQQGTGIASTWYSFTGETIHIATTDSNEHTVALYLLNYDAASRTQSITAQTTTGTVLDASRPFTWPETGVWAVYKVCGSVDFVLTPGGAPSAVVSGVFLGPPSSNPTATNMLVDTAGGLSQVVAETDGSGNLTSYYVRSGDQLLAVMRPGSTPGTWTTRYVHHDGLGSVRALTDETGTTIDTRGYEAFGTKNAEAGNDPLSYGFAGEPFQQDSMLAYHRARWMDARVGRFLGMDPFQGIPEAPATLHRYSYVWNGPTDGTDPSGLTSPINFIIGRAVHDAIAIDFLQSDTPKLTYPKYSDRPVYDLVASSRPDLASNWVYKVIWGVGLLARPDLSAPNEHVIFEVKSVDDADEGESKVLSYLELLNYLDPTGNWTAGSADQFTPQTPITVSGYPVEVAPPVGGLILYTIGGETRRSIAAAIAAAAAGGIAALALGPVAGVAGTAGF